MNRPSSLPTHQPRISVSEIVSNLALVGLAIVVTYFFCIGVVSTALALGWSA